jgi:hypothetical protein
MKTPKCYTCFDVKSHSCCSTLSRLLDKCSFTPEHSSGNSLSCFFSTSAWLDSAAAWFDVATARCVSDPSVENVDAVETVEEALQAGVGFQECMCHRQTWSADQLAHTPKIANGPCATRI